VPTRISRTWSGNLLLKFRITSCQNGSERINTRNLLTCSCFISHISGIHEYERDHQQQYQGEGDVGISVGLFFISIPSNLAIWKKSRRAGRRLLQLPPGEQNVSGCYQEVIDRSKEFKSSLSSRKSVDNHFNTAEDYNTETQKTSAWEILLLVSWRSLSARRRLSS